MILTPEEQKKIKVVRMVGDNDRLTIVTANGNIIKLKINKDGTLETIDDVSYREKYWKLRAIKKISAEQFSRESCVALKTLRTWERQENVTRMTEEKIKATVNRLWEA